jgi:hypothetical protein
VDSSSLSFLEPWRALPPERAEALLREVRIELSPGHPLYGADLAAIAVSRIADDALFRLDDGRVAKVHLTWSRAAEQKPWPSHRIYASFEEWAQQVMIPDHEWDMRV